MSALVFAVAFVGVAFAQLLELDESSFKAIDTGFVAFVAPWCPVRRAFVFVFVRVS